MFISRKLKPWEDALKPCEKKQTTHKQDIQRMKSERSTAKNSAKEQKLKHRIDGLRHRLRTIENEADRIRKTLKELESDPNDPAKKL